MIECGTLSRELRLHAFRKCTCTALECKELNIVYAIQLVLILGESNPPISAEQLTGIAQKVGFLHVQWQICVAATTASDSSRYA